MPRRTKPNESQPVALSEASMRNNFAILEYTRTCQAAAAGCTAGILGLTSLYGFIFYFIWALVQSGLWFFKSGGDWSQYFLNKSTLLLHGLSGGLFTYILFWTFLYGMVHVY